MFYVHFAFARFSLDSQCSSIQPRQYIFHLPFRERHPRLDLGIACPNQFVDLECFGVLIKIGNVFLWQSKSRQAWVGSRPTYVGNLIQAKSLLTSSCLKFHHCPHPKRDGWHNMREFVDNLQARVWAYSVIGLRARGRSQSAGQPKVGVLTTLLEFVCRAKV